MRPHDQPAGPGAAPGPGELDPLQAALEQSKDVKAKVEACADDLASANDAARDRMAAGVTTFPTAQVLRDGVAVEQTVEECADGLHQVTLDLARGLNDVKAMQHALGNALGDARVARVALAASQMALSESIDAEREASSKAMHDGKTGLPNRTLFDDRLAQAMAGAERRGWTLALLFIDLDRFKLVNDTHGHAAGDAVLAAVAQRLAGHARDEDTVCRNGGDEFLYLLINPRSRDDMARVAESVAADMAAPIVWEGVEFTVRPSIGIAMYPGDADTADALIARADAAMYRAKRSSSASAVFDAPPDAAP